jgi:hypothetical protein
LLACIDAHQFLKYAAVFYINRQTTMRDSKHSRTPLAQSD